MPAVHPLLQIWCLLLPFGLTSNTREIDWVAIIAVAVISLLLLVRADAGRR